MFSFQPKLNILILGFYDRNNAGDEMYKHAFSKLLKGHHLTFACTDDVAKVPPKTDVVVCGGGEIINDYFMNKVVKLLNGFYGQVYAVSVGLSGDKDARHLHVFDHVFMRNTKDYKIAKTILGERNCTYLPDITQVIPIPTQIINFQKTHKNIGVCLAQPVFYNKPKLLGVVVNALVRVAEEDKSIQINIFNFNTHLPNAQECDIFLGERIMSMVPRHVKNRFNVHYNCSPFELFKRLGHMDFNLCMRFHSVMFSIIQKVPFLAIFKSRKVDNLLEDMKLRQYSLKLEKDADVDGLYHMFKQHLTTKSCLFGSGSNHRYYFAAIPEFITRRKQKVVCSKLGDILPLPKAAEVAHEALALYLASSGSKKSIDVARVICHALTGNIEDPCVWGLSENMDKAGFVIEDAMKYVHEAFMKRQEGTLRYCPPLKLHRRCLVSVDPYHNGSFEGIHRSGWGYVVDGLMNLDARHLGRHQSPEGPLLVDTYVDRTFHWGQEVAIASKRIPYTSHWVGFVHHTFEEGHSENNCTALFQNPLFLNSLKCCKALIALSEYMTGLLRTALKARGVPGVAVHTLTHPTEFVNPTNAFSFEKFLKNPNKKLVQIGAWLRNPYAIYKLPLDSSYQNPMGIRKAVLKGKDMESYFCPDNLMESLEPILLGCSPSPKHPNQPMCRPLTVKNRYTRGMLETIIENDKSVEVINYLDNRAYDDLLSQNIVFLNLVDCSAVNTVLECIVRCTPVIVNRHPALEEVLGSNYPGFYNTLLEAGHIVGSRKRLEKIHRHMVSVDKSKIHLETFLSSFMDIVKSFK